MNRALFRNEVEAKQHEEAVSSLCQLYPQQCEFIQQRYEELLAPLIAEASIRTYLPIFISRQVSGLLEREH